MGGTSRIHQHLLYRNVQWFRGVLVFKAHKLVYHSALGTRVMKKRERLNSPVPCRHGKRNCDFGIGRSRYILLDTLVLIWDAPPDVTFASPHTRWSRCRTKRPVFLASPVGSNCQAPCKLIWNNVFIISLRESTPAQNRNVNISMCNSKQ